MLKINGHSRERRNDFCIWSVERDGVTVASFYGGGSLSISVAAVEGEVNKDQPDKRFGEYDVEFSSEHDAFAIKGYGPVALAYVFGPEAETMAKYAAAELNRNDMFFDNYIQRAQDYFVPNPE